MTAGDVTVRYAVVGGSGVTYDEAHWPFLVISLPAAQLSEQELIQLFARIAAYIARGDRFGLVMDVRIAPAPDAAQRRWIAREMDQTIERGAKQCIGVAVVIGDRLQRGVFNTLLWLRQTRYECVGKSSVAEAFAWLQDVRRQQLLTAAVAKRR